MADDGKAARSPSRQALLEKLRRGELRPEEAHIPVDADAHSAPASFAQERLWLIEQLAPRAAVYSVPLAARLLGPLDRRALAAALRDFAGRHEPLRTTFSNVDGALLQHVDERPDFIAIEETQSETALSALAQRPFDLQRGPLWRVALATLAPDEHVLLLDFHHIVLDGWSIGVTIRDLAELYRAHCLGVTPELPVLKTRFLDYARWQRVRFGASSLASALTYWRQQLADAPPSTPLPFDRPPPATPSFRGERVPVFVPQPIVDALAQQATAEGATLFMALCAAFATLLGRYAGARDVAFGTPVAGRGQRELDGLLGFFVNTLVVRADLAGEPTFRALLRQLRGTVLDAFRHADLPFEQLARALRTPEQAETNPLFNVMFVLQNAPTPPLALHGLRSSEVAIDNGAALFDLLVGLHPTETGLAGWFELATDRFERASIAHMARAFETLLAALARAPDALVMAVPLVEGTPSSSVGPTPTHAPTGGVHRRFEAQARRRPDAMAVEHDAHTLSYRALDGRASDCARRLTALGVGPGAIVAVCVERSVELLVALFGVLKAGAAYLPLEPSQPRERLQALIEEAKARAIVTDGCVVLDAAAGVDVGVCDGEPAPGIAVTPDTLAYVIFTSGSTGKPKGVEISHGALDNLLAAMATEPGLGEADVLLAVTSVSFDIAGLELFLPLLVGARIVIASRATAGDGALLREKLDTATVMQATPSTWRLLFDAGWKGSARLTAFCGGEALRRDLASRLLASCRGVWNLYGPTETTIWSTVARVTDAARDVPLGQAIAHTQLHVLEPSLCAAPIGMPGELYIGGAGVARGYLGRPDLTAERFVTLAGARVYRTGDRVRRRPDGSLDYLGRLDDQVKIRGVRVEPAEVEAALVACPGVAELAVAARPGAGGDWELVAWAAPASEASAADLQEHAARWQSVWQAAYAGPSASQVDFDTRGWSSSYTHEPIAQDEMRDWVDDTVTHILRLCPRRVLEIGCGTGLLLFRLAPHCERYDASDFSPLALARIRAAQPDNVRLFERAAHDTSGLDSYDLVILNSVAQYLPSLDAFIDVLRAAVAVTAPEGALFLGDLRSLPLLPAFHESVRLATGRQVDERELAIDPALFAALAHAELPRIAGIALRQKGGRYANEMTRFRFDACLRLDQAPAESSAVTAPLSALGENVRPLMRVSNLRNARLSEEADAVAPEALETLATRHGLHLLLTASEQGAQYMDALFARDPHTLWPTALRAPRPPVERARASYANDPLLVVRKEALAGALRRHAAHKLPLALQPTLYEMVARLPRLPSGKIDRNALAISVAARASRESYVPPRTPHERALAEIWEELLDVRPIGGNDDFFALGGHSLLAARVVARVRDHLHAELPVAAIFQASRLSALAQRIDARIDVTAAALDAPLAAYAEGPAPLAFAQEGLWFLHRLQPTRIGYSMPVGLRIRGKLDVERLGKSLDALVLRHEPLRTTIGVKDGVPRLTVAAEGKMPLALRSVTADTLADALREATAPLFDLTHGPLCRATLLGLAEHEHLLVIDMHHLVSDGWSVGVVVADLVSLYSGATLAPLAIAYSDFTRWLHHPRHEAVIAAELPHWRERLAGTLPVLPLPTDRARCPLPSFRGRKERVHLPTELANAVAALGQRSSATPFMVLLAAFATVLARYAGVRDLCIGVPVAYRNRPEFSGLVGMFTNTLALRIDLDGNPSVDALLARVREVALGALAHQDVPFERLVAELKKARRLDANPLVQVMFAYHGEPMPRAESAGLSWVSETVDNGASVFDLNMLLWRSSDGIDGWIEYSTDLFDRDSVVRLLACLRTLLEGMVADPARAVFELPLLTAAEERALMPPRDVDYSETRSLHAWFETQVDQTPDAIALVYGEERLTYRQLDERANRAAHALGIAPGTRVALCFERSLELVVAVLAVLKAGGTYVPIDPSYPEERRAFMVQDAGAPLLLTTLPDSGDATRMSRPGGVAYVIYTSGSTGTPKGVEVTHANVTRLFTATAHWFHFGAHDVWTLFHSYAFDFSVWELWGALLYGGRLVIVPQAASRSPRELHALLARERVTVLNQTPSAFRALVDADAAAPPLSDLRYVIFGGEAIDLPSLRPWFARYGDSTPRLINMYGITETTVHVTYRPLTAADVSGSPIGRPIADLHCYVLDEHRQLVPIGVPGELYVGGAGVAQGYLHRPELTRERFVADPFDETRRLYKTGDACRWLSDGSLEYLGRIDQQVKIRGFRIELGEIEAVLQAHPEVKQAVVVAREDVPGDKRLVAYVVGNTEGLRAHAQKRLPEYMLPAVFIALDTLPLTQNGKIDRKALPAPSGKRREATPGRTPTEERLAAIWCEVLRIDGAGPDDDFFALGGHSLLATQVVSRMQRVFSVELPVRAIFEMPRLADLAAAIDTHAESAAVRIPRAPRGAALPLSFAQERLWFLERLAPGTPLYNVAVAVHLGGALDVAALTRALRTVVARHEVLRTRFVEVNGQGRALLDDFQLEVPVASVDAQREALKPFDLSRGPLVRATLVPNGPEDHILILVMHHIVCDGWSMGVLVRELGALYEGRTLPELPIQYADYAAWQTQTAQDPTYWLSKLRGAPSDLSLPFDHPRRREKRHGATLPIALPLALSAQLAALGRDEGVTLFMTLLAGFYALLQRYTREDDLVVGTPIAGRTVAETEALVGLFVNTLVLRTTLAGQPTVRELLLRVKETTLEAYTHQAFPFDKLVEALVPTRDALRTPLFQIMFVFENTPLPSLTLGNLEVVAQELGGTTAKFDLTLRLREGANGITGVLEYDADAFDASTIKSFAMHYTTLLTGMVTGPSRRVSELSLSSAEDRPAQTAVQESAPVRCVHETFEAQVERTPDAIAISAPDGSLSYRALDRRANRLARHLRSLGVGPEVLVGVCLERSADLIVAVLAILKAGGAYLPIDPHTPKERIAFMLEDAAARVLVTERALSPTLPAGAELVSLDLVLDMRALDADDSRPASAATPDNVAYVIYTSGSTGKPKGVQVTHANVVRLFSCTEAYFHFGPHDVWTLFHSAAFDFSVWEMWGALFYGGRLVVVALDTARSPKDFHALLAREGVTVLNQTPSAFRGLVAADAVAPPLTALRLVIFGGEAIDLESLRPWFLRYGEKQPELVNMYGITETTVHVTHRPLGVADLDAKNPIGRPLPDLYAYIMDAHQALLPTGVPGELYVGGAGVARGYLHRKELTAERFIRDPFHPSRRLYKTGDLCRRLPDGSLEYLGRIDQQVKIRGHRIELGEIEAVLRTHRDVAEATVVAREDAPGDRRLVAYVVGKGGALLRTETLRAHLQTLLPAYMVPAAFVILPALPLTQNGKLDVRALPAPGRLHGEFVAPATAAERALAEIWRELLGVERVGSTDDFFALGGHSLLAVRVVARMREKLEVELEVGAFFRTPTLGALARQLDEATLDEATLPDAPLVRSDGPTPLSSAQEGLWFLDALQPDRIGYTIPVGLRLLGPLDVDKLRHSLDAMVARHEPLRMTIAGLGRAAALRVADKATMAWRFVDASAHADAHAECARVLRAATARTFDLQRGPLCRAILVRLAPAEHLLLVDMHHIICDGWSIGIFVQDLVALYRGENLPELPVRYADFTRWQHHPQHVRVLETELPYWLERLAGTPPVLPLPTDRPRPALPSFRGNKQRVALDAATSEGVLALAQASSATPFMVLLAGFAVLLSRLSGTRDLCIGAPVAYRNHAALAGLVGMFANTLALRIDLAGEPSFLELLARVRETTLGGLAHQNVPFERVVAALRGERRLDANPLFQVMFTYHGEALPEQQSGDLQWRTEAVDNGASVFDLNLFLWRGARGIDGWLEYSTDLFDAETVEAFVAELGVLLRAIVKTPELPIGQMPLLPHAERERLLCEIASGGAPHGEPVNVHAQFAAQVQRTPDAVVCGERKVTYAELDAWAEAIARRLATLPPGGVIALLTEPSLERIAGVLAILRAGHAYLPLDPRLPDARLRWLFADAGACAALTTDALRMRLPAEAQCFGFGTEPECPPFPARSCDIAYVIYTSGSTGTPKGVVIGHSALAHSLAALQASFQLSASDVVLSVTSLTFDIAALEIFLPLSVGARIAIASDEEGLDGARLAQRMTREGVTFVQSTPSRFRLLLAADWRGHERLQIVCGGEAMSRDLADALRGRGRVVWNVYGPTEATVWCMIAKVEGGVPTIGRPLPGNQCFVLDARGEPVPIGVVGELCIGGVQLAEGYRGRPDLTAERFIAHAQGRLYRSGDRVSVRRDGQFVFHGRLDAQVKVRGLRIEPGEIEAALCAHAAVREAAVAARPGPANDMQLHAYVVADGTTAAALAHYLREQLPAAMVPMSITILAELPRLPGGKLDRGALPQPMPTAALAREYVAPRTPLEDTLCRIWRDVLGVERVGVFDTFFDLGGASIASLEVVARARAAGLRLSPEMLFQYATVAALAAALAEKEKP